jgi:hypothetical protein
MKNRYQDKFGYTAERTKGKAKPTIAWDLGSKSERIGVLEMTGCWDIDRD